MSQHYILVQLKVKAEATKRLYAMLCTAYKTKNVMYQQSIQNGVLAFPLLFLLMLVGCDTPSTIEEIGMEQNTAFESEKAISDAQEFANKVTLVKFIDPIAEVP